MIEAFVLALAAHAGLPAPAAAETHPAGPPSTHRQLRRNASSGVDKRVALLSKALGLDPKQEAQLRRVLEDQRRQVLSIWNDESKSATDRIIATRNASKYTADRIRALLNEEQRKKYNPPQENRAEATIRDAHVEDWMNGKKKR
jgi:hypothetical protein